MCTGPHPGKQEQGVNRDKLLSPCLLYTSRPTPHKARNLDMIAALPCCCSSQPLPEALPQPCACCSHHQGSAVCPRPPSFALVVGAGAQPIATQTLSSQHRASPHSLRNQSLGGETQPGMEPVTPPSQRVRLSLAAAVQTPKRQRIPTDDSRVHPSTQAPMAAASLEGMHTGSCWPQGRQRRTWQTGLLCTPRQPARTAIEKRFEMQTHEHSKVRTQTRKKTRAAALERGMLQAAAPRELPAAPCRKLPYLPCMHPGYAW